MHGIGRTVFQGNRVEEFQVEILGILDNYGPKESIILGRLSGGPLEHTGVMHENSVTFDGDILADGKYYFRVVTSDRESNPQPSAREAQLTSAPILIDNTPPNVTISTSRYAAGAAHVEFEAADASSPLRRCEYSLDAASWIPVSAADGVIDGLRERFTLDLPGLSAGEHLLVLRVADSANNTGLAKVVLK